MRYFILFFFVLPFNCFADTFVWKVSKGSSTLFIGGTIHVLSAKDYPLPNAFERAYKQSDILVFETDLAAMAKPDVQQELLKRLQYKNSKTLQDDLNKKTYKALVEYASSIGLNMETLKQYKAPMIIITLLMTELNRLGMADTGVDRYFNHKAIAQGKRTAALESIAKQLQIIENMGKGHESELIMNTIDEMKQLPTLMGDMKKAWRNGNIKQLEQLGLSSLKKDHPALYKLILVNRNNAWLPKIKQYLATPKVEFILVGALHLVAKEGIISQLRKQGYRVQPY